MKKLTYLGLISFALLYSCRPKENPAVASSTADSFSPGIAKTGDTVSIIGTCLMDSKVMIDDKEVSLVFNDQRLLKFVVNDEMTKGKSIYALKLKFPDGSSTTFSQSIVLNHIVNDKDLIWLSSFTGNKNVGDTLGTGPSQLLLTDFDGHGVRTANATDRFDQTQWTALVKTGGSQLITNSFLGVTNPPSKNNFYAMQLNPEFVGNGTYGFAGELINTTDFLNDRKNPWSANFSEIPGSPIAVPKLNGSTTDKTALDQTYLNFFFYKNNKVKGLIRPYLFNNQMSEGDAFSYNIPNGQGNGEWSLVSIPFRSMKTEYGNTTAMKFSLYSELNKLKFVFTHSDKAKETSDPATWKTSIDDVQFYIDHIIITQGGPYINPPTK